jgi:hypothetical protein
VAVREVTASLEQDSDPAIESVVSIITEFAEWLADGADNASSGTYETVFTDEFMDSDIRSWDQIARDFIKVYAERQARIARMR